MTDGWIAAMYQRTRESTEERCAVPWPIVAMGEDHLILVIDRTGRLRAAALGMVVLTGNGPSETWRRAFGLDEPAITFEVEDLPGRTGTPKDVQEWLTLVAFKPRPSLDAIGGWTKEQRDEVIRWAALEHLFASDKDVVQQQLPVVLGG